MPDIKLEDLSGGDENLDPETMKGIHGGAGLGAAPVDGGTTAPPTAPDPNQLPIIPVGPNDPLPGQGDPGNAGGGSGSGCQL